MPPHIHPDVEEMLDSPEEGGRARLVLVVEEEELKAVVRQVRRLDGELHNRLPSGVLTISLPETSISDLCGLEVIRSISPDNELRILA
jgi:hypothetical protein